MNRLNELRYLKARRRLIQRAIARRHLAPLIPWLKVLDDSDHNLVLEWWKLDKAARPVFQAENERLAYILTLWDELFVNGGKPADFEERLYPGRREQEEQARREKQIEYYLKMYREQPINRSVAVMWLGTYGVELPELPASQPPKPAISQQAAPALPPMAIETVKPQAPTVALKPIKPVEETQAEPEVPARAPRCLKCRGLLQPSRSDPAKLVCNFCGFPVGDSQALNQLAQSSERLWWDR